MAEQASAMDMTPGLVSWNELATRDSKGSISFYTQLFGWKAETMSMGPGVEYTMLKVGDRMAGGLIAMPPQAGQAPTSWISYVTVADLPSAVAKAQSLGAKVCKDITQLPMGRFAIISDPQGAVLGLWEFGAGTCGAGS